MIDGAAVDSLAAARDTAQHGGRSAGFALDDRYVARAGLDYWPHLDVTLHDTWEDYLAAVV